MEALELDIDPDVRRARTPPAAFYRPGVHQRRLLEAAFAPQWQWLADAEQVPAPEGCLPVTLLPGSLDEPLVVTRQGSRLLCLSNVCTHRGMPIALTAARTGGLRCAYHGRRFSLDGRMLSAPGFEGAADFPGPADDLASLPLEAFGPWLFTRLADGPGFERLRAPLAARIGHLPLDRLVRHAQRSRRFEMHAHWALYVENYLEGLHIPYLHTGLAGAIDWTRYRYELFDGGVLQVALAGEGDECFRDERPAGHPDGDEAIAAWYFWFFPNLMVNVYPWGVSMNRVRPLVDGRTAVDFEGYVWDAERLGRGAGGDLDRVEREDEFAVEAVQRGLAARLYRGGRYAPEHEAGSHHFHRLCQRALEEARP